MRGVKEQREGRAGCRKVDAPEVQGKGNMGCRRVGEREGNIKSWTKLPAGCLPKRQSNPGGPECPKAWWYGVGED